MLKKFLLLFLAWAVVFDFTGCASMSAQARRERAYRHYVQKQMKKRQREIARAQKAANRDLKRKMKNAQPSEPKVTASAEEVPLESTSSEEQVVPMVTVSASEAIAAQSPEQPSRP